MNLACRLGIVFFILLGSSSLRAAIFGPDDRQYVRAGSADFANGRATAIGVIKSLILPRPDKSFDLWIESLSSTVCKVDRFSADPSLSYACTGFLLAPDLLVTAGHCMVNTGEVHDEPHGYCEVYSWLFDFRRHGLGTQVTGLSASRLYSCKRIVVAFNESVPPYRDFALVQLDRSVLDRQTLKIAARAVEKGDSVRMIGYPLGGPQKSAGPARVTYNEPTRGSFVTNLDALDGNSGSPVFNAHHEVVGILIAGTPSAGLVQDGKRSCSHYNQCKEDGSGCHMPDAKDFVPQGFQSTGSEVERISEIKAYIAH